MFRRKTDLAEPVLIYSVPAAALMGTYLALGCPAALTGVFADVCCDVC